MKSNNSSVYQIPQPTNEIRTKLKPVNYLQNFINRLPLGVMFTIIITLEFCIPLQTDLSQLHVTALSQCYRELCKGIPTPLRHCHRFKYLLTSSVLRKSSIEYGSKRISARMAAILPAAYFDDVVW